MLTCHDDVLCSSCLEVHAVTSHCKVSAGVLSGGFGNRQHAIGAVNHDKITVVSLIRPAEELHQCHLAAEFPSEPGNLGSDICLKPAGDGHVVPLVSEMDRAGSEPQVS